MRVNSTLQEVAGFGCLGWSDHCYAVHGTRWYNGGFSTRKQRKICSSLSWLFLPSWAQQFSNSEASSSYIFRADIQVKVDISAILSYTTFLGTLLDGWKEQTFWVLPFRRSTNVDASSFRLYDNLRNMCYCWCIHHTLYYYIYLILDSYNFEVVVGFAISTNVSVGRRVVPSTN